MILAIATGLLLTVVTIAIHATGTAWWIERLRQRSKFAPTKPKHRSAIWLLSSTATLLLSLQLLEVIVWAAFYLVLPDVPSITSLEDAAYFSMVTFTTLGYGDITLAGSWRMLSAIQGTTGLLICGWSTAILIAIVQSIWGEKK
jgi:voltage-gated potassium channel Kch